MITPGEAKSYSRPGFEKACKAAEKKLDKMLKDHFSVYKGQLDVTEFVESLKDDVWLHIRPDYEDAGWQFDCSTAYLHGRESGAYYYVVPKK